MIYFLQVAGNGPVKIGFTAKASALPRLKSIQRAMPYDLVLLGVMGGGKEEELHLHYRFLDHAIRNEWFRPHPDLLTWIAHHAALADGRGSERDLMFLVRVWRDLARDVRRSVLGLIGASGG